jgi:hypothetical protein
MGSRKRELGNKNKEIDTIGEKGKQIGDKLKGEGDKIKGLLDQIDTNIDEEDKQAVTSAESGYKSSFTNESGSKINPIKEGISEKEKANIGEADAEKRKVTDAAKKFQDMKSVSDVGRSAAGEGEAQMRRSEEDYKRLADDAKEMAAERAKDLEQLQQNIAGIFN